MSKKHTFRSALVASALVLGLGAASLPPARAQGAFYQEESHNGRIYVFNSMKAYDAWKKSGGAETGVAITRVGAGPNGETIVFDSDDAIHLYNFKHGKPGEVIVKSEEKKPTQKITWKDGKTTWETDTAAIAMSNRIQVRYTLEDPEAGTGKGSFRIRRAKTKFEGWAVSKNLTFEVQLNWPDTANPLEDVNLQYDLTGGGKAFLIKAGQFKVPFARQELTSSGSQQFVDRSIVSGEFQKGRDIGLQLWGTPMGGKLDWRVGIFNGAGRTKTANDNKKYQYNARLTFQPMGDVKYSESDFESTDRPLLAIAGNFESNDLRGATDGNDVKRTVIGGDVAFKFKGFSAMAEVFSKKNRPEEGDEFKTKGWHAQAGYLVVPKRFELAARYARFDPTDAKSDNDRKEYGIAANYFWSKHALKIQGDFRWIEDVAKKTKDKEFRLQTQLIF